MDGYAGKQHPAPAKICPFAIGGSVASPQKARLATLSCLTLGARCGETAAALFFEKSQSEKERGETAAAPNLKKEKTRHPPKERANEKKKDPAKHPKKRKTTRKKPTNTQAAIKKQMKV
jgi:hypothetical protein